MKPGRLFAAPIMAMIAALVLLLFALTEPLSRWIWLGALIAGLAVGILRGATMAIVVDQVFDRVRLPRGRHTFWIAIALAVAIASEIAFGLIGHPAGLYHAFPSAISALCAGMLFGRSTALAIRIPGAPHEEP